MTNIDNNIKLFFRFLKEEDDYGRIIFLKKHYKVRGWQRFFELRMVMDFVEIYKYGTKDWSWGLVTNLQTKWLTFYRQHKKS